MAEHEFYSITKQRVTVDWLDGTIPFPIISDTDDVPERVIGCGVCDMGIDEAGKTPCPGHSVTDFEIGAQDVAETLTRIVREHGTNVHTKERIDPDDPRG